LFGIEEDYFSKMKFNSKKIIWSISIALCVLIAMGGVLYWQRNHILERIAKVKLTKIEKSRHVNITFSKMRLDGLDDLYVSDFKIQQPGDTAFLYMGNVHCKLGIWGMMRGDVVLNELDVKHILINAIERNHHRNFEFLFRSDDKSQDDDTRIRSQFMRNFRIC
jgi:hypothetical protein